MESMKELNFITQAIEKTKATNVEVFEVSKRTSIADYIIIATASSSAAVLGVAGFIMNELEKKKIFVLRTDGFSSGDWVVLDYANIIVHVLTEETRDYFKLDKFWKERLDS